MKVLIACEESQTVCKAFRELGHEAYSCDIIEPSGGHPEWHILGDALEAIKGGQITTMDGVTHDVGKWDMLIAHPPCTYLSNVATRSFSLKCTPPEKVCARWAERAKAAVFFMHFILADIPHIAVENPVGFMNTAYRKPDQIIHPYMFADSVDDTENYVTKATCLWLKGLPKLKTNKLPKPDLAKLFGKYANGKNRTWEEVQIGNRAKARSKTFPGVAKAMAEQWGDITQTSENIAEIYMEDALSEVDELPVADVVSRTAYDQTAWERDLALQQLKSIGKGLGERLDDVAPVVRCKDCTQWDEDEQECKNWCGFRANDFCSFGAKSGDEPTARTITCKDCCHSYDDFGSLTCSYGPCLDCIVPKDFWCKHGEKENWYERENENDE